jgi:N-acetylated-alpha-linked acidic dipeptidase
MRLADAEVLPFDFVDQADTLQKYSKDLQKLLTDKHDEITERNRQIDQGVFKAIFDPRHPTVAPPPENVPPFINFAPMQNAADRLAASAERYRNALAQAQPKLNHMDAAALASINRKLMDTERALTNPDGLLRRPWYKHLLYAPGVYTGYGVKTVPGVREGIEQKRYSEAEQEVVRVAKVIEAEAAVVDSAATQLEQLGR